MNNEIIQKVTGVHLGFTNTTRTPFALYKLACGHLRGEVPTKGCLVKCNACGAEFREGNHSNKTGTAACACGNSNHFENRGPGLRILALPNPHNPAERLTQPVACRCEDCEKEEAEYAMIPEYVAQSVHSRWRPNSENGYITFYRRDPSSPSGVRAIAGIAATKRAEELIRSLNSSISPLSPTEGLGGR